MTYTYAIMKVSPELYAEVLKQFDSAGYQDQLHETSEHGIVIDMHGIALSKGEATQSVPTLLTPLSEEEKRTAVSAAAQKLTNLLADPHAGLWSWNNACEAAYQEMLAAATTSTTEAQVTPGMTHMQTEVEYLRELVPELLSRLAKAYEGL